MGSSNSALPPSHRRRTATRLRKSVGTPAPIDKFAHTSSAAGMALPFPSLTRHLNDLAAAPGFDAAVLRAELGQFHAPLLAQIEDDAAHPERFADWGMSSNLDSGARAELVHPSLLAALCGLSGLPMPCENSANAGLLHTYGYLLSNCRTPFGFKRERWTRPELEDGLGLRRGLVSAVPLEGTLLGNVTTLMRIIWKPGTEPNPLFADGTRYTGFTVTEQPEDSSLRLITRLIPFPAAGPGGNRRAALFHAWDDGTRLRFVTVFPVDSSVLDKLRRQSKNGTGLVKPRYNSVIPELGPEGRPGRILIEPWESPTA